ncbi:MAG: hypothetical protein JW860_12380 [Sedimentisphaerales bacterium]|nr:hypothetical protein [Sedimentisphaerales bacterium]
MKDRIMAILFFGGLWGLSEALLGNYLYTADIPHASVPLTVIGLIILSIGRVYFPQAGMATLIAAFAMIYKFFNAPFFACHLLGILMTGMCYDLFFGILNIKNRSLSAVLTVYAGYIAFGVMITYIFRYEHWVQGGLSKLLQYILISGTMAAVSCAILVPVAYHFGEKIKARFARPFNFQPQLVSGGTSLITTALWIFGIATLVLKIQ